MTCDLNRDLQKIGSLCNKIYICATNPKNKFTNPYVQTFYKAAMEILF